MQRHQARFFGGFLFAALLITTPTRGQNVVDLQNRLGQQLQAQLDPDATSPASRGYDTMLYVSGSGPILMLGGEAHAGWSTGMTGNGGVWSLQPASGRWSTVSESVPLNSLDTSITYNTRVGRVIVFQSYVANAQSKHILPIDFVSETWAYDQLTGSWENRHPAQSPPPGLLAGGAQIAYDWLWDKVVMFGGLDLVRFEEYLETCATACNNSLLPLIETNHTWVYDFSANTWTDMTPASSPAARNSHALVYDAAADRVILFGGGDVFVDYNDTWAYDYQHNTWTELHPATLPDPRSYGYLAYNSELDRIVLFGGVDYTETILYGDTWVFDYWSQTWTLRHPATSPSPRGWFGMTYSPEANAVAIFGGGVNRSHFTNETWVYRLAPDEWAQVP